MHFDSLVDSHSLVIHTVHTFTVQSVMRFVFYSRQAVSTGPALTVLCGRKTARGLRGNQRFGRHHREVPVETGHRKRYMIHGSRKAPDTFSTC